MSTSATWMPSMCPRVPEGFSDRITTFLVRFPTCGRKSSTPFKSRAPRWSYCNALLSVSVLPSRRNGLHGPFFPLVDGVDPAASGDFVFLDMPRIRQDEPVADLPPGDRRRQRQRGVARARLGREAQERRRLHAAVHGHFSEDVDPGPELIRVRDTAAERRISDDDLGGHIGGDRSGSRCPLPGRRGCPSPSRRP